MAVGSGVSARFKLVAAVARARIQRHRCEKGSAGWLRGFIGCPMRDIRQQIPSGLGLARSVAFSRCSAQLRLEEEGSGSADTRVR